MRKLPAIWSKADPYHRFELILTSVVVLVIGVIACVAVLRLIFAMIDLLLVKADILNPATFQTLFGMIFIVLIALEFNRTIIHSLSANVGVAQIKGVILVAIMVIVRKLIVSEPKSFTLELMLGMAALLLALGLLYFLVSWSHRNSTNP